MKTNYWPKYFLVDYEMYVKIHVVDGKLIGTNDLGSPYNIARLPINSHVEVTKKEFEKGSVERRKMYPPGLGKFSKKLKSKLRFKGVV